MGGATEHAHDDSNIGGAGILLSSLTEALSEIFDLTVFLPKGAKLASALEAAKIKVHQLPMAKDKSFSAADVQGFFSLFKSYPADIVHTHGALSARLGARLYGKFDPDKYSPIESMRNARIPVIFIHGDTDDFVPYEMQFLLGIPQDQILLFGMCLLSMCD